MLNTLKQNPIWRLVRFVYYRWIHLICLGKKDYQVDLNGTHIRFLTDDAYSFRWFYPRYARGRIHEPQLTADFQKKALHAAVIVDIGCHLGWFLCIAAKTNPRASIHGFELDEVNLALCQKNITANQLDQVHLNHTAVSDTNGALTYGRNDDDTPSPKLTISKEGPVSRQVATVTLDHYFHNQPFPELIKMDVQGAEFQVLKGMTEILKSEACHTIYIEIHPQSLQQQGYSVREIWELLMNAGYSIAAFDIRSNHLNLIPLDLESSDGGQRHDFLMIAQLRTSTEATA